MSKRAFKMLRQRCRMEVNRKPVQRHEHGYPIFWITDDCAALCHECVCKEIKLIHDARPKKDSRGQLQPSDDKQWNVVGYQADWEDGSLYCAHCSKQIESAYGEPEPSTITEGVNS